MESAPNKEIINNTNIQKSNQNIGNNPNDELLLFTDEPTNNNNNNVTNNNEPSLSVSSNQEEMLTGDDYYLECARFGELTNGIEAMKDADKTFNVNLQDFHGNTALHMASANGHIETVKYLGNTLHCDINALNKAQSTPLSWAAINGQKEVVKFLGENKADFSIKNSQGKTAGEEAYDRGYYDISEMIIEKETEKSKNNNTEIKEEKIEGTDAENELNEK